MMHRILQCFPDDASIFDVGANVGFFSLCFKSWFPKMTIHAFEPVPFNYEYLQNNLELNGIKSVITNNIGLYNETKTIEFFASERIGGASSIKNIIEYALPEYSEDVKKVKCKVITLDSYAEKTNARIDFLKCDTEGAELFVYMGGIRTIKKYKPVILSEIAHAAAFGHEKNDVVSFLSDIGYLCYYIKKDQLIPLENIACDLGKAFFIFIHSSKLIDFRDILQSNEL